MLIAFCNQKGGVGKSTLAVHVAVFLHEAGHRIAFLDADRQRSSSGWASRAEPKMTIAVADDPDECLEQANDLKQTHDIVVADGPGTLDEIQRTLFLLADHAVLPLTPSFLDLRSLIQTARMLRFARSINAGRPDAAIVLNKTHTRGMLSQEIAAVIPDLGIRRARAKVRYLKAFRDAPQQGSVVWRMGPNAAEAAADIRQLCDEILASIPAKESREAASG